MKYGSNEPRASIPMLRTTSRSTSRDPPHVPTVGPLHLDENGVADRGLCTRHLVLPNDQSASRDVLAFLKRTFDPQDIFISLMAQYRPLYGADRHALIGTRVDSREYEIIKRNSSQQDSRASTRTGTVDTAFIIDFKTRKEDP